MQSGLGVRAYLARLLLLSVLAFATVLLAGCERSPAEFFEQAKREWRAAMTVLQGGRNPLRKKEQSASEVQAELVQEIFRVVLLRDPAERGEFTSYVDLLAQGASIEGVHNGLTHTDQYRKLEQTYRTEAGVLEVFCREWLDLGMGSVEPSRLNPKMAEPLSAPVPLEYVEPSETSESGRNEGGDRNNHTGPREGVGGTDSTSPEVECNQVFSGAAFFTLKRVLADEAIRVIREVRQVGSGQSASPAQPPGPAQATAPRLSTWYGRWAALMANRGVDFGLALRNKADEKFHRDWASSTSDDKVTWEVLNRVHRVLNEAQRKAASGRQSDSQQGSKEAP